MLDYTIYYEDESIVTPITCELADTPAFGVLVIVQYDPVSGWYCRTGKDYYCWQVDEWTEVDIFGLWDYLAQPGWKKVLYGRTVPNEKYQKILQQALQEKRIRNAAGHSGNSSI